MKYKITPNIKRVFDNSTPEDMDHVAGMNPVERQRLYDKLFYEKSFRYLQDELSYYQVVPYNPYLALMMGVACGLLGWWWGSVTLPGSVLFALIPLALINSYSYGRLIAPFLKARDEEDEDNLLISLSSCFPKTEEEEEGNWVAVSHIAKKVNFPSRFVGKVLREEGYILKRTNRGSQALIQAGKSNTKTEEK